ncbi:MAG: GNAT family N-acetyltransferase [Fermentimonas sp.]|nr:GNAT family N-acetyltransferase [Fermentimonas sp.]
MNSNDKVILEKLSVNDANIFYSLYANPHLSGDFDESSFLQNETPTHFTERIITSCKYIFTIRPKDNPELIIGDCALHHWNQQKREIEIGGSLLPKYWGKGYMQAAFELLIIIAKKELRVEALLGQTKTSNIKAIRFSEKMGFVKHQIDGQATIMRKEI